MSFQLEVHSPDRPRFAVVERIAAFISARGSFAISLDLTRILQCVQKGWLGVRLSETAFVWLCLGKTDLCIHVTFMRVFSFCFGNVTLCPGGIRVYVSCRSDVIELVLSCCFVVALLLPFSRWWRKQQIRLSPWRESWRIEPASLRETCCIFVGTCCCGQFKVYGCRFQWNGFPWIWLVDCWQCLWDCSCFIVDGLENNTKVLVLLSWWIIPQKGVRSNFGSLRKCVSENLSMYWA